MNKIARLTAIILMFSLLFCFSISKATAGIITPLTSTLASTGTMTIIEITLGGEATFHFTVSGGEYNGAQFDLTTGNGQNSFDVPVTPGVSYTVTEGKEPAGWVSNDLFIKQTVTVPTDSAYVKVWFHSITTGNIPTGTSTTDTSTTGHYKTILTQVWNLNHLVGSYYTDLVTPGYYGIDTKDGENYFSKRIRGIWGIQMWEQSVLTTDKGYYTRGTGYYTSYIQVRQP